MRAGLVRQPHLDAAGAAVAPARGRRRRGEAGSIRSPNTAPAGRGPPAMARRAPVGLDDGGVERILAVEQGRAEGRGGGEGVQRGGHGHGGVAGAAGRSRRRRRAAAVAASAAAAPGATRTGRSPTPAATIGRSRPPRSARAPGRPRRGAAADRAANRPPAARRAGAARRRPSARQAALARSMRPSAASDGGRLGQGVDQACRRGRAALRALGRAKANRPRKQTAARPISSIRPPRVAGPGAGSPDRRRQATASTKNDRAGRPISGSNARGRAARLGPASVMRGTGANHRG